MTATPTPTPPTARAVSEVLEELAARCEAANGPDRELDCEIAVALLGYFEIPPRWDGDRIGYGYFDSDGAMITPGHGGDQLVRQFTRSLDAAMTLVPGDLRVALVQKPDATWGCALLTLSGDNRDCPESDGALASLALTAAALRSAATLARETEARS